MKIGILGCGGMGGVHANKYASMPEVSMMAFDVDTPKLEAFCTAKGAIQASSLNQLLESNDAIDICLPTPLHKELALQSLAAGKPTLVEKPMARTVAQCQEMIEAASESGALLVPAHVVRFFPEYMRAHNLIVEGKIGKPASIRMRRGGGAPKAEWFLDIEKSGGILLDLAVHEFDWLLWTLGPATMVTSRSVRLGEGKQLDFKGDYALTTISFSNGAVAHVESTWMDPSGGRVTLEVSGERGSIDFDSRENPTLRVHTGVTVTENNYADIDDPYFQQLTAFVEAAQGKREPAVTMHEGLEAVRIATAAIHSASTGEPIQL